MTKTELIKQLARHHKMTKVKTTQIVDEILTTIMDSVANGDDVVITGFGTFRLVTHAAKRVKNPRTSEMMDVPAHKSANFRLGKNFKELLNK